MSDKLDAAAEAAPLGDATGQVVAIIGWGTAGVNAAIALRAAGYTGAIRAFSDTDIPPYSPILTSYYAGGEKTYDECFPWSADELAELEVEVVFGSRVVELDCAAHRIVTEAGRESSYDKCIICVGAHPTTVGFPEDCGYDPLVLRTMDDAARMKAAFEDPACSRVLVSGASMIALKCVEAALNRGLDVSLVGVNDHILDFSALPAAAERFERGLAAKGVSMRFGQAIERVEVLGAAPEGGALQDGAPESNGAPEGSGAMRDGVLPGDAVPEGGVLPGDGSAEGGDASRKLAVTFSNGDVETYDEIVVAHGVRSDFGFIKDGSIAIDHAIVVDDFMRASAPDVFAAGDAAQALELTSGEKHVLGIWKTAALQGQCAGRAAAAELAGRAPSKSEAYPGAIMTNTIAVNGTLFISAGASQVDDRGRVNVRESDDMTVVCLYEPAPDGERLVGFNVVSDVDEPGGVAYDTGAMLSLRIEESCRG